jgi:hypothetical protein
MHPSVLKPRKYIFLLSHMRGYTTVLGHILGSHREISGYAETWTSYQTPRDLLKLRCVACSHGNYKPTCTYFFDKMLHNRLQISDSILKRTDIQYIFMVRRPVATIRSMVVLYRKYVEAELGIEEGKLLTSVEEAALHYTKRMTFIAETGIRLRRVGKRAVVIRGEDFIDYPRPVLAELESFLGLKGALNEHYSVFNRTGAWNFGDPSEFILRKKIERVRPSYTEISMPDQLTETASREYERCLTTLTDCFPLVSPAKGVDTARSVPEYSGAAPYSAESGVSPSI